MDKKTLVLGASMNKNRYSNIAIRRLVQHGQDTVAIGLRSGEVSDILIRTDLVNFENIDTVTLYMNPSRQVQYYDYIVGLQPRRVIFNPGTENPEFYKILRAAHIKVEIACTLVLLSTNQY